MTTEEIITAQRDSDVPLCDKRGKLEVVWQEASVGDVMRYFAKGFEPKSGEVTNCEWFYDPHKGKVLFKLYVREATGAG